MDKDTALATVYLGIIAVWGGLLYEGFSFVPTTLVGLSVGIVLLVQYRRWPQPEPPRPERPQAIKTLIGRLYEFGNAWNQSWHEEMSKGHIVETATKISEYRDGLTRDYSAALAEGQRLSTKTDLSIQDLIEKVNVLLREAEYIRVPTPLHEKGNKIVELGDKLGRQLEDEYPV